MRRVARQERSTIAPTVGDARVKCVHCFPLDLDRAIPVVVRDEGSDRVIPQQFFLTLAGKLHELPANTIAHGRHLHAGPPGVAMETDLPDAVAIYDRVDNQPALFVGRPDEFGAEHVPDGARAPVAPDDEFRLQSAQTIARRHCNDDLITALLQPDRLVSEQHFDAGKPRQSVEQHLLELRLVEGADWGMAIGSGGGNIRRHQGSTARVHVAYMRALDELRRHRVEQPDQGKEPQGFGIVGDGSRDPTKIFGALQNGDLDAGQAEQIRRHQPDRAGSNHCHVDLAHGGRGAPDSLVISLPPVSARSPPEFSVALYGQNDYIVNMNFASARIRLAALQREAALACFGKTRRRSEMATNLMRFEDKGGARWGVVLGTAITPLAGDYPTTSALIERGEADWREARRKAPSISLGAVRILAPVTTPCRIYCQGANYRQHMIESGMDPDAKLFNMFFTKADASITSAREAVARPQHVKLLDYEIELALVFRRAISSAVTVTRDTLADYVFALTIANDLSARDVQLPQTQFFKGKSYRGFCPVGPWLTVLEQGGFRQNRRPGARAGGERQGTPA